MIHIHQPALALNSTDFDPRDHYQMRFNEVVPRGMGIDDLAERIHVYVEAAGGRLTSLIVNAHGMAGPDGVAIGTGLHGGTVAPLARFRGLIGTVYMCACQVADTLAGQQFCQDLAMRLQVMVVASVAPQITTRADRGWLRNRLPQYQIDDFEGPTYCFHADGGRTTWTGNGV